MPLAAGTSRVGRPRSVPSESDPEPCAGGEPLSAHVTGHRRRGRPAPRRGAPGQRLGGRGERGPAAGGVLRRRGHQGRAACGRRGTRELRQVAPGGDDRVLTERNRRDALVKEVEERGEGGAGGARAGGGGPGRGRRGRPQRDAVDREARAASRARDEAAEAERHARWVIQQRKAAPDEGPAPTARRRSRPRSRRAPPRRPRRARARRTRPPDRPRAPPPQRDSSSSRSRSGSRRARRAPASPTRVEALEAELDADKAAGEQLAAELRECAAEESRVHARLKERGEAVTRGEVQAQRARDHAEDAEASSTRLATKLGLDPEPSEAPLADAERARCTPASSACSAAASSSARSTRSRRPSTRRRSSTSRSSSPSARTWRPRCASSRA